MDVFQHLFSIPVSRNRNRQYLGRKLYGCFFHFSPNAPKIPGIAPGIPFISRSYFLPRTSRLPDDLSSGKPANFEQFHCILGGCRSLHDLITEADVVFTDLFTEMVIIIFVRQKHRKLLVVSCHKRDAVLIRQIIQDRPRRPDTLSRVCVPRQDLVDGAEESNLLLCQAVQNPFQILICRIK